MVEVVEDQPSRVHRPRRVRRRSAKASPERVTAGPGVATAAPQSTRPAYPYSGISPPAWGASAGASQDLCLRHPRSRHVCSKESEGHSDGRDFSVVMRRRAGRESVRAPCQGHSHEALSRLGGIEKFAICGKMLVWGLAYLA